MNSNLDNFVTDALLSISEVRNFFQEIINYKIFNQSLKNNKFSPDRK